MLLPVPPGYVGAGMLSAAVAGGVFASPPPASILAAILSLHHAGKVHQEVCLLMTLLSTCLLKAWLVQRNHSYKKHLEGKNTLKPTTVKMNYVK